MKTRIAQVRKSANLNQTEFAERLNLTKNYISLIENGNRTPSERTVSDICREFGVNRTWLETGAGEPFQPEDRTEIIAAILGKAITGNDSAKNRLIRAFAMIPDDMFEYAEKILDEILEELQKEKAE